jgi:hypothetical protein
MVIISALFNLHKKTVITSDSSRLDTSTQFREGASFTADTEKTYHWYELLYCYACKTGSIRLMVVTSFGISTTVSYLRISVERCKISLLR